VLRLAERNCYNERFNEVKRDVARTWRIIRIILPKAKKGDGIREIKVSDSVIKDSVKICNTFNEFFVGIESNLAENIPSVAGNHREFISSVLTQTGNLICLQPVMPQEIVEIVSAFKGNKSPGFDDISPLFIISVIFL